MAINIILLYNDRFLPDNLLLTQDPIFVWFDDNTNFYGWLCMAINLSV